MRIDKITLTNFRQYYGVNAIDLKTKGDRNIILIGGKNGYGKTNFLMSLVWCLYGEDIVKIDDGFKKEIQKEGNYSKFLKGSLNWDAEKEFEEQFSIEIELSEIELPDTLDIKARNNYRCRITRTFNIKSAVEDFKVEIEGVKTAIFNELDYKKIFVNDYLIPIEAAKFVFFDAEKIASWAELSTKEEGSVLNDALGKILGLDIYEMLVSDLEQYADGLRKESATANVKQQINAVEKGIQHNVEEIEKKEMEIFEKDYSLIELKQKISEYEVFLSRNSRKSESVQSLDQLYKIKRELEQKDQEIEGQFNQLCEIIPFAIAAGRLEEVIEHLSVQNEDALEKEKKQELLEKNTTLLEKLFNSPPYPNDGDISFSKKMFYAEKAKRIIEEVFGASETSNQLDFEHDLNKSESELINHTYELIRSQSKTNLDQTIDAFTRVNNDILENDRLIRSIEADQQDEEVIRYSTNKLEVERKIEKLLEEKGALQNQVQALKKTIEADNQKLQILIKRIEVSEQKRKKLDKATQYNKILTTFIGEQKRSKCSQLENVIFEEMQKLMHKLHDEGKENFIAGVKAIPLPDNDGLKITLVDVEGETRLKESLSQGEKQIYISSLIKAILSLSIQEFPIFIDTPLGRLDDEHIKNILLNYYPDLATQVILMATNNEIPPSRFKLMRENVSQTYLLVNKENKTTFKQGYFQSYEN